MKIKGKMKRRLAVLLAVGCLFAAPSWEFGLVHAQAEPLAAGAAQEIKEIVDSGTRKEEISDTSEADEMSAGTPGEGTVEPSEEGTDETAEPSEEGTDETGKPSDDLTDGQAAKEAVEEPAEEAAEEPEYRSLKELEQELDAALAIGQSGAATAKARAAKAAGEPTVGITKTAHWPDIEEGYAQIDLTEQDTAGQSNQAMDYLIILDRTRTMSLNDKNFEGNVSDSVNSSHSPCLNRSHYYEYDGKQLDLYDHENGVIRGTDQVMSLPADAAMYTRHRNADGTPIAVDYGNGCVDRLSLAKETICGLIDRIAANSPKGEGAAQSRVSYWSFAGTYWPAQEGEIDTDLERGLFNYIGLTGDYAAVKQKVQETKVYAGTYYQESMKRAYEQLAGRTGSYKNLPSKVIFISDGKCSDDYEEIQLWNNRLKAIPGCTVYTLAVGMPPSSEGGILLKNLSSAGNASTFAAFTTNLNSSNPAFANTLTAIEQASVEVNAVNKVLTDRLDTKYWDYVEILSADGQASCDGQTLTWNVPQGAGKTYRCSLKVRLKDEYRYLISDTSYPTNADTAQAKGCRLNYEISGGQYHAQKRTVEAATPRLKYGTLRVEGEKGWKIPGSQAGQVKLVLSRRIEKGSWQQVNEVTTDASKNWKFTIERRKVGQEERLPLVRYTNEEKPYEFELTEETANYTVAEKTLEEQEGVLKAKIVNEPYFIRIRMEKQDAETKKGLSGAVFAVYAYSRSAKDYVPWQGGDTAVSGKQPMKLAETAKGIYETKEKLYYTPDNEGRFRIIEEQAPQGYFGDFAGGNAQNTDRNAPERADESTQASDKNVYDVQITKENTGTLVSTDKDGKPLVVENTRVKGKLCLYKKDADSHLPVPQGTAVLFYEDESRNACYGLYAAQEIRHPDGESGRDGKAKGVLWEKDELVAKARISSEGFAVFEDLDLGTYYVKELEQAPEGYLLDPTPQEVTLSWQGEAKALVVEHADVYEPVKKQSQTIYKVAGADDGIELTWVKDAGFSVFALSALGDVDSESMTDQELVDYIDQTYRNPRTLTYEAMKELPTVLLYENGKEYHLPELLSENGIIRTPPLPFGDYVIVETTVPKKKRPVAPLIVHVREDENDKDVLGDGKGTVREARILRDRDVLSHVRIRKMDALTGTPVTEGQAGYVIRDVEGSFREWYFSQASFLEKAEYLLKYNGLVVEYDKAAKQMRGTYENPFRTVRTAQGKATALEAVTENGLPPGLYELCEVEAPEGYILQGEEGCIAKDPKVTKGNQTFYETQREGAWTKKPSEPVRFIIDEEHSSYDSESDCWWTEVEQENTPAIGKLSILAEAEIYQIAGSGATGREELVRVPQKGAEFALYAGADIRDGAGNLRYKKGDLVEQFVTDVEGKAWSGTTDTKDGEPVGLPVGSYRLVQTKLGEGLRAPEETNGTGSGGTTGASAVSFEERTIEINYADSRTPVIYRDEKFLLPAEKKQELDTPDNTGHTKSQGNTEAPKTGDTANTAGLLMLLVFSLFAGGILIRRRTRK